MKKKFPNPSQGPLKACIPWYHQCLLTHWTAAALFATLASLVAEVLGNGHSVWRVWVQQGGPWVQSLQIWFLLHLQLLVKWSWMSLLTSDSLLMGLKPCTLSTAEGSQDVRGCISSCLVNISIIWFSVSLTNLKVLKRAGTALQALFRFLSLGSGLLTWKHTLRKGTRGAEH